MTSQDILKLRLVNQFLVRPAATPEEVVSWMGATQAQDYMGALWGVALRTKNATVADIQRAIQKGKIIRTWPQRGTLHFVDPQEIRWMLKLSTPRIITSSAARMRQLNIDEKLLAKAQKLFIKALKGGNILTRNEMYEVLEKGGISTKEYRGLHILGIHSMRGLICFGPHRGKQPTFVLLDEWVPKSRDLTREKSVIEFTKRFFLSHGPATLKDLNKWAGMKLSDARIGVEANKKHLTSAEVGGKTYWMAKKLPKAKIRFPIAHLLPPYDEYLVGYKDRHGEISNEYVHKIFYSTNGVYGACILLNTRVVGGWRRAFRKGKVVVAAEIFEKVTKQEQKAIDKAIERYQNFIIDIYRQK